MEERKTGVEDNTKLWEGERQEVLNRYKLRWVRMDVHLFGAEYQLNVCAKCETLSVSSMKLDDTP
jgi:hypothetical protein